MPLGRVFRPVTLGCGRFKSGEIEGEIRSDCCKALLIVAGTRSCFTSPRFAGRGRAPTRSGGDRVRGHFQTAMLRRDATPPHPARTFGPRHPLPASGEREKTPYFVPGTSE